MPYRGDDKILKYNYVETIKRLVPDLYLDEDRSVSGTESDIAYEVLGKIILAAVEHEVFFNVSARDSSATEAFFVPINAKTRVSANDYKRYVLSRFDKDFSDFKTSGAAFEFLRDSVFPQIVLNNPSTSFVAAASADPSYPASSASEAHEQLLDNLGLAYILNTSSAAGASTELSSVLLSSLTNSLYFGEEFAEEQGISVLLEYCWRNREDVSTLKRYLPPKLSRDDSDISALSYSSGIQDLDRIKTYAGVWLEPGEEDANIVGKSLTLYNDDGTLSSVFTEAGSLGKFLRAIGYAFYDVDKLIDDLQDLFDVEECPIEFLDYLARTVGWRFLGEDITLWRGQLRQAIYTYKAKGTRKALTDALSYVFPKSVSSFDPSSNVYYTFESYLPFLIYYALKTESAICKDPVRLREFLVEQRATNKDGLRINVSPDQDTNIRFCVDAIMEKIHKDVGFIDVNGQTDIYALNQGKGFEHRGTNVVVPPWEKHTFYKTTKITRQVLDALRKILEGNCNTDSSFAFDIRDEFIDELINYIIDKTTIGVEGTESLTLGNNNFLRFYTFSANVPPNYSSVISDGASDELSVLDYWNTRSSNIFVKFPDNTFTGPNRIKISDVRDIANVVYEYTPLHVVARLYVPEVFTDDYDDQGDSLKFTGRLFFDDKSTNQNQNYNTSGWIGTSGDPSSWTWSSAPALERTTGRRKNFRYVIDRLLPDRQGKSMPMSMAFYSTSAIIAPKTVDYFAPKGFDFNSQSFVDVDGGLSSIYDTSNSPIIKDNVITQQAPEGSALGVDYSAMFPVRAYKELDTCSISPEYRIKSGGSAQTFYDITLRQGLEDSTKLIFSEKDYISIQFSPEFHQMWADYRRKFNLSLDSSSLSILNHAYGPGFYNNRIQTPGVIADSAASSFRAYSDLNSEDIAISEGQLQRTIGARDYKGQAFRTNYGELIPMIYEGLIQQAGYGTYRHEIESYLQDEAYCNETFLSGVQIVAPERNTEIAVRSIDELREACDKYTSGTAQTSVTVFGGRENTGDLASLLRVRYPLTNNRNHVVNGDLVRLPDSFVDPSTSSIYNWELLDQNRSTYFSGTGLTGDGNISVEYLSSTTETPVSSIRIQGASGWGGSLTNAGNINTSVARTQEMKRLIPGSDYTLTYDVSSQVASGGLEVFVRNQSQDLYLSSDGSWTSSFAYLSSAPDNITDFYQVTKQFSIPVSAQGETEVKQFGVNDAYQVGFTNVASSVEYLKDIFLREDGQNILFKDEYYRINVKASCEDPKSLSNSVAIRILAYSKLEDGDLFAYSKNGRWEKILPGEAYREDHVFVHPVTPDGEENDIEFRFQTLNERGPLDRSIRQPLYVNGGSKYRNVHSDKTEYYVEFIPILQKRTLESDAEKPFIKIFDFSFINEKYEKARENYTRNETKELFEFFNGLKDSSLTRDPDTAETLGLGVSGGSRLDYIDYYGGSNQGPNFQGFTIFEI